MKMLQPLMKDEYSKVKIDYYPPDPDPNVIDEKTKYDNDIQTINDDNFKINEAKFDDPKNIFNQLYNDVETRDNIGEFSWYIYSGLFIMAIVSYNLAMISCK